MLPVLVTGATGRVGSLVIDNLLDAGVPVRALTRRSEASMLPPNVEVVAGDLTVPESAVEALALYQEGHAGGDYVLTGPESLSQAEQVRIIGEVLGRRLTFEELTADEFRSETPETWPRPVVDMLLEAWKATLGVPAFVT